MKNIDETEKILYDTIGNPTTYRDATMSWYGRQLTKYKIDKDTEDDTSDDVTFDFTYDADGLRGSKVKEYYVKNEDGNYVAKSEKTIYQYVGDKLYYEKRGDYQEFYYFYDSYGKLSAIYYNFKSPTTGKSSSAVYFVTTNSQGDVIGLYNNKGVKVAAYEYDAWGNILSVIDADGKPIDKWYDIANANPFRYRGYYYDADLGLYYLQSRYYDSTVGRFINADTADVLSASPYDVTDKNLYAYCDNNPITRADDGGQVWNVIIGAAIGGAISLVSSTVSVICDNAIKGEKFSLKDVGQIAISTTIGALEGAAIALCPAASVAISAAASAADTAINGVIDGDSAGEIVTNSLVSGAIGAVAGSGGSEFVKGGKLINDAAGSVGNAIRKGVHPVVKKSARKIIKKAAKKIGREYVSGQLEDFAYGGIYEFTSFYTRSVVRSYRR